MYFFFQVEGNTSFPLAHANLRTLLVLKMEPLNDVALKRIEATLAHLLPELALEDCSSTATIKPIPAAPKQTWNIGAMTHLLEFSHHEYKKKLREFLKDPLFLSVENHDVSLKQNRERTLSQVKKLVDQKVISIKDYKKFSLKPLTK